MPPDAKAGAAFVLASICDNQPKGQAICSNTNLLPPPRPQPPPNLPRGAVLTLKGRGVRRSSDDDHRTLTFWHFLAPGDW